MVSTIYAESCTAFLKPAYARAHVERSLGDLRPKPGHSEEVAGPLVRLPRVVHRRDSFDTCCRHRSLGSRNDREPRAIHQHRRSSRGGSGDPTSSVGHGQQRHHRQSRHQSGRQRTRRCDHSQRSPVESALRSDQGRNRRSHPRRGRQVRHLRRLPRSMDTHQRARTERLHRSTHRRPNRPGAIRG